MNTVARGGSEGAFCRRYTQTRQRLEGGKAKHDLVVQTSRNLATALVSSYDFAIHRKQDPPVSKPKAMRMPKLFPSGTAKTEQNSTARQGHHKTTTQISYVRRLSQKQKLLELTQNMSQRSVRL